jgi:hypothetical protein
VTVHKTDADLKALNEKSGPEIINAEPGDADVKALKARFPEAKNIEKLPTGVYAVRFHKKRAKYLKGSR